MIHVAPVDADLRARNASWGVRDLVDVRRAAAEHRQFERERHTLPANKLVMLLLPARHASLLAELLLPARHASLLAELLLPARHASLLAEFERRSTP